MTELLGLHTKREMGAFIPERTWQRWVQREALAAPFSVDGFRNKARLFFEASLVPVILSASRRSDDAQLLHGVAKETRAFFASAEFLTFSRALHTHIDRLQDVDIASVGRLIAEVAPNATGDLNAAVARHEQALRAWSVEFRTVRAVFVQFDGDVVHLRTGRSERLQVPRSRFAGEDAPGAEVLVKHVSARGAQDTFVLPMFSSPALTDSWKSERKRALDDAAAIAAADDGAVSRAYGFLYRWDADEIAGFQRAAADALGEATSETEWDAFLAHARDSAPIVVASGPPQPREPAGVFGSGDSGDGDDWQRRLLETPSPLAGLPSRRQRSR
jgi:hypothetical protein